MADLGFELKNILKVNFKSNYQRNILLIRASICVLLIKIVLSMINM